MTEKMTETGKSILRGLEQAIAYAKGDTTKGTMHRVKVQRIDVRNTRLKLGLSQDKFALAFGVSAATVRNWEQGRREPEGPAKVLLNVIAKHPEIVIQSLLNN